MNKEIYKKVINSINTRNSSNEKSNFHLEKVEHNSFLAIISSLFNYVFDTEKPNKNRILEKIKKDTLNYSLTEQKIGLKSSNYFSIKLKRWAVAAIFSAIFVGSFNNIYKKSNKESNIIVQAEPNEKLIFFLPDSSEVWLNKGSKLQYRSDFMENREVLLTGEAYFDIRKNENEIFEVRTNNMALTVLGTTFNVKSSDAGDVEVKLYTGKVNITVPDSEQIILAPMQRMNFIASKTETILNEIDDDFDWKSGIYKFDDKPLGELVLMLNQLYNVRVEVKRSDFNENVFSGQVILSEPIDNILEKICINTGLTLSHTNNSIILY